MSPLFRRACMVAALVLLLTPVEVRADAKLVEAQPPSGGVVSDLIEVMLRFDQALIASKSSIEVRAADVTIASGGVTSGEPSVLRVAVQGAQPGTYEVRYTAGSQDGHLVRGTYSFSLAAPSPPPTAAPTLSATTAPTAPAIPSPTLLPSPSPTPTPAPASAAEVVVPIVAALALVAVAAWFLLRRGRGA